MSSATVRPVRRLDRSAMVPVPTLPGHYRRPLMTPVQSASNGSATSHPGLTVAAVLPRRLRRPVEYVNGQSATGPISPLIPTVQIATFRFAKALVAAPEVKGRRPVGNRHPIPAVTIPCEVDGNTLG
jgi:hypothetical protein